MIVPGGGLTVYMKWNDMHGLGSCMY